MILIQYFFPLYIKLNRQRMKGASGSEEARMSLNTLFDVLFSTTLMMSCFTPFISEFLYLNLRNGFEDGNELKKDSIHFLRIPEADETLLDDAIVHKVSHMKKIVEMTRSIRDNINIPIKKPIQTALLVNSNPDFAESIEIFGDYIKEEINAYELLVETDENKFVNYSCDYNQRALGPRLKDKFEIEMNERIKDVPEKEHKKFKKALKKEFNDNFYGKLGSLSSDQIKEYMVTNKIVVEGVEIVEGDLTPTKQLREEYQKHEKFARNTDRKYDVPEKEHKEFKKVFKKEFNDNFYGKLGSLSSDQIKEYMVTYKIVVEGVEIVEGDLTPTKQLREEYQKHEKFAGNTDREYCVLLDKTSTEEIEMSYTSREFLGRIQKLRKEAGLKLDDDIEIFYLAETEFLEKALNHHIDELKKTVMKPLIDGKLKPACYPEVASTEFKLGKETGKIYICKPSISFQKDRVNAKYPDAAFVAGFELLFETFGAEYLKLIAEANGGVFKTKLDGQDIELKLGEDFHLDGFKSYNF